MSLDMAMDAVAPRPASTPAYGALRDGSMTAVLVTMAATAAQRAISDGGSDQIGSLVGQVITVIGPIVIGLGAGLLNGAYTYLRKKLADHKWLVSE